MENLKDSNIHMFNSWTLECSGPAQALEPQFQYLNELKTQLDHARPLPEETVKSLQNAIAVSYTYNSNAIEGNSLTLMETKVVIEDGITIGGKSIREHLEAINHKDAIDYIEHIAKEKAPLDERTVKDIHSLVLKGIDQDNAGRWRNQNVFISGATHKPPDAIHVPDRMEAFFKWCSSNDAQQLHTIERAARIHADFVNIHPFIDGNGRTARLLMNLELIKDGFPMAIVPIEQRLDYYNNLNQIAITGNYEPFIRQTCELTEKGFDLYSMALGYSLIEKKSLDVHTIELDAPILNKNYEGPVLAINEKQIIQAVNEGCKIVHYAHKRSRLSGTVNLGDNVKIKYITPDMATAVSQKQYSSSSPASGRGGLRK